MESHSLSSGPQHTAAVAKGNESARYENMPSGLKEREKYADSRFHFAEVQAEESDNRQEGNTFAAYRLARAGHLLAKAALRSCEAADGQI